MEELDTAYVTFDGADLEAVGHLMLLRKEIKEVIESRENSGNGIL